MIKCMVYESPVLLNSKTLAPLNKLLLSSSFKFVVCPWIRWKSKSFMQVCNILQRTYVFRSYVIDCVEFWKKKNKYVSRHINRCTHYLYIEQNSSEISQKYLPELCKFFSTKVVLLARLLQTNPFISNFYI